MPHESASKQATTDSATRPRDKGCVWSEAYWVLFRFLYEDQFSGPVLIIIYDEVLDRLLDAASERGVELTD